MKAVDFFPILGVFLSFLGITMATIRWSLSRQSQLLQHITDARIIEITKKLEVLHVDFKEIIRKQEIHLHEIEKKLLNYQKTVAETYVKKEEYQNQFQMLLFKIDKISGETKSYHKSVLDKFQSNKI
ncbi:hypothetical protein KCM76_16185 [Zooshikella marina]|uniref:hypothetical protein n=1 Tax=Zooshikella ganghwensis TaxID=202772 RepID=UPI001BAED0AE|nr:hypothetical protein [Zooshikella ganghwensis]MBU2707534.1 hypothetical protein [Zooshikella ganghwensis]